MSRINHAIPSGLCYYQPLRDFMKKYSLSHKSFDDLINLSCLLKRSGASGKVHAVSLKGTTYRLDWNAGKSMEKIISSLIHMYSEPEDNGNVFVSIASLYQALISRGSQTYPHIFEEFMKICTSMPCTRVGYPVRYIGETPRGIDRPDVMAGEDIITHMTVAGTLTTELINTHQDMADELERAEARNMELMNELLEVKKKCRDAQDGRCRQLIASLKKLSCVDKMIEDNITNIDMYCYEISFDRAAMMLDYSFNGYYISRDVYNQFLDESIDSDLFVAYLVVPYTLDYMKTAPKVGRLSRAYPDQVADVKIENIGRGKQFLHITPMIIRLAVDCYLSSVPIDYL